MMKKEMKCVAYDFQEECVFLLRDLNGEVIEVAP